MQPLMILSLMCISLPLMALEPLTDTALKNVSGQGGVYLSGDLTINADGGPLNVDGPSAWTANCDSASASNRCGGRIAVNTGDSGNEGWFVLDNIRGRFSFEGLTLKTRSIDSGFSGDGAVFDNDVLEIGLPNSLEYEDVLFTVANSNSARPTDAGFVQTDIFTLNINGESRLQGNLLVFPTGAP